MGTPRRLRPAAQQHGPNARHTANARTANARTDARRTSQQNATTPAPTTASSTAHAATTSRCCSTTRNANAATDASTAQHAEHAKHDSRSEIRHGHRQVHPSRHREESSHEGAGRSVHLRLHPDARRSRESPKDPRSAHRAASPADQDLHGLIRGTSDEGEGGTRPLDAGSDGWPTTTGPIWSTVITH